MTPTSSKWTRSSSSSSSSRSIQTVLGLAAFIVLVIQFSLTTNDDIGSSSIHTTPFFLNQQVFTTTLHNNETRFLFLQSSHRKKVKELVHQGPTPPNNNNHNINNASSAPFYYMVFSTSCSPQQNWESYVFFFHAFKVRQPGTVTRIVSGCNQQEEVELLDFHEKYIRTMSDRFHVHFTPSYARLQKTGQGPYKYMNKPYGLRHWMEHELFFYSSGQRQQQLNTSAVPSELADSIVMLLDPDMILLRPLMHDFSNEEVLWVEENPVTKVVRHGFPIAQQDGYLNSVWTRRNFSHVTNLPKGKYIEPPPQSEGKLHWNSGPPYLATVQDMYQIAIKWTEYVPRLLEINPELFTEMFGFIIATVQLNLPFTFIKSLVVSTTQTGDREGWPYIDALPNEQVCIPGYHTKKLPIGLHYCKRYLLGNEYFFSKYRLKKNIMDCDKPLLKAPSTHWEFHQYSHGKLPPAADLKDNKTGRVEISSRQVKREAFMLCQLVNAVNEALRYLKQQKCGTNANLAETYLIHEDPSKW